MRAFSFVTWQLMAAAVSWACWAVLLHAVGMPNSGAMRSAIYLWTLLAVVVPLVRRSDRRADA